MISKLSKVLDRIDRESEKSSFLYEELVNKIIELENRIAVLEGSEESPTE